MCTLSLAKILCIGNAVHQPGALSLNNIHLSQHCAFSTVLTAKLHKSLQAAALEAEALSSIHVAQYMNDVGPVTYCE